MSVPGSVGDSVGAVGSPGARVEVGDHLLEGQLEEGVSLVKAQDAVVGLVLRLGDEEVLLIESSGFWKLEK